jgi:hypothetical protein
MLLQEALNKAVAELGTQGAFIKLSIRSPKDATLNLPGFYQHIERVIKASQSPADSTEAIKEDLDAVQAAGMDQDLPSFGSTSSQKVWACGSCSHRRLQCPAGPQMCAVSSESPLPVPARRVASAPMSIRG